MVTLLGINTFKLKTIKAKLPKGMRDFSPLVVKKRKFLINTIKNVFELYGFQAIETPTMESLEILANKGGEESDKLMFRVLNSGDFLNKVEPAVYDLKDSKTLSSKISEKGLRYDLTVPLARYVAQHQNTIVFPFKRYQIQPVWRADRPQKGRYREFWQCDADVLGSNSLLNEVDLVNIYAEVFKQLKIDVTIKYSSRKLLAAMAELIDAKDKFTDFVVALDKLDKIGVDKVKEELLKKGINSKSDTLIDTISKFSNTPNSNFLESDLANQLKKLPIGSKAIEEITFIKEKCLIPNLQLDPSLARGLDYYTGPIFEATASNFKGSLGGGGRYDELTSKYGLKNVSGVGISFGLDRIYDLLEENNLFEDIEEYDTKALFINFDSETIVEVLELAKILRTHSVNVEVYPDASKMKKQMKYADDKHIPFVIFVGSDELKSKKYTLKDMKSGQQESLTIEEIISRLK